MKWIISLWKKIFERRSVEYRWQPVAVAVSYLISSLSTTIF